MKKSKSIRNPGYDLQKRPFMIIWEVTQACDLNCRHCRASAMPEHHPQMLNLQEGKKLLDDIAAFGRPSPLLIFTGGDPFKREDLQELIDYGHRSSLMMALSPSGTPSLNKENLERVKQAGIRVISLSLDGASASTHDSFRRVPGSFKLTCDGWRSARELGLKVQLNTTVTRRTLYELPGIFELVAERGVLNWSIFFLVPIGRGVEEEEISPEEYEAVMHFLYDCSKYVSVKTTEGHHFKRIVLQRQAVERAGVALSDVFDLHPLYFDLLAELRAIVNMREMSPAPKMKRTPMHINAAEGFVFVSHTGEVYPSGFLPVNAGSVRKESLVDVYQKSPLFTSLRDKSMLKGRCRECEYLSVCSGSRSRAYAITSDLYAEEPYCNYQPHSFPLSEFVEMNCE